MSCWKEFYGGITHYYYDERGLIRCAVMLDRGVYRGEWYGRPDIIKNWHQLPERFQSIDDCKRYTLTCYRLGIT